MTLPTSPLFGEPRSNTQRLLSLWDSTKVCTIYQGFLVSPTRSPDVRGQKINFMSLKLYFLHAVRHHFCTTFIDIKHCSFGLLHLQIRSNRLAWSIVLILCSHLNQVHLHNNCCDRSCRNAFTDMSEIMWFKWKDRHNRICINIILSTLLLHVFQDCITMYKLIIITSMLMEA